MDRVRVGDPVSLQLPSQFSEIHGRLGTMEGSALPLPPGVLAEQEYKGIALPTFYTTRMPLGEAGERHAARHERSGKNLRQAPQLAGRIATTFGNCAAHPLLVNEKADYGLVPLTSRKRERHNGFHRGSPFPMQIGPCCFSFRSVASRGQLWRRPAWPAASFLAAARSCCDFQQALLRLSSAGIRPPSLPSASTSGTNQRFFLDSHIRYQFRNDSAPVLTRSAVLSLSVQNASGRRTTA